jgi:hypothetical protein
MYVEEKRVAFRSLQKSKDMVQFVTKSNCYLMNQEVVLFNVVLKGSIKKYIKEREKGKEGMICEGWGAR